MNPGAGGTSQGSLFTRADAPAGEERFEVLLRQPGLRIERIVSNTHVTPPGQWYDQAETEWVMLLRGKATLEFADGRQVTLAAGDWLTLPPHCRHRIAHTGGDTVWLAVHADQGDAEQ